MKKIVLLLLIVIFLVSCIPGDGKHTAKRPAGILWGIWHGWISPISLIIGIFNPAIRVYEVHNMGWFYDLGFYLAIVGGFGALSLSRKKNRRR